MAKKFQPYMTDPVSGRRLQKGRPVPTANAAPPRPPDTGPMPPERTRSVPRMGRSLVPGLETGETTYAPDPRRPSLRAFKGSRMNDLAGATGRIVNPGSPTPPSPGSDAMRRGRPQRTAYSGDLESRIRQGVSQIGDAYRIGAQEKFGRAATPAPVASPLAAPKAKKPKGTPLQQAQAQMKNTKGYEDFPPPRKAPRR